MEDFEFKLEDESVDLIASGYEWTCPHCEENGVEEPNRLIEVPSSLQVVCYTCGRAYRVFDINNALE